MSFNTRADAPLVWSVYQMGTKREFMVKEVVLVGVNALALYRPEADNISEPRAFIEGYGRVTIDNDMATIWQAGG